MDFVPLELDVAVGIAVVVEITVALSGNIEPEVRLTIADPCSIENGDRLPFVLLVQEFLDGSAGPQQKRLV